MLSNGQSSVLDSLELQFDQLPFTQKKLDIGIKLTNQYSRQHNTEKTEKYSSACTYVCAQINDPASWASFYRLKAVLAQRSNDFDSTFHYCNLALKHANLASGDVRVLELKRSYFLKGEEFMQFGRTADAFSNFIIADSLHTSSSSSDPNMNIINMKILTGLSSLYGILNEVEKSITCANEGLIIAKKLDDKNQIAAIVSRLGQGYLAQKRYPEALKTFDTMLHYSMANTLLNKQQVYISYFHAKTESFYQMDLWDSSIYYAKKTLELAYLLGDFQKEREMYLKLYSQYANLKQKDSCYKYIQLSKKFENSKDLNFAQSYNQMIAACYASFQDFDSAYQYIENYAYLQDSIHSTMYKNELSELEVKYETAQKEKTIAEQQLSLNQSKLDAIELEKNLQLAALKLVYDKKQSEAKSAQEKQQLQFEAEIKRQEIITKSEAAKGIIIKSSLLKDKQIAGQALTLGKRKVSIIGFAALTGILLLVSFFAFYSYNTKRKTAELLASKNEKIETLITELQHRTKNNMQVMSSLLSLQSDHVENTEARNVLDEGKNRIDAMTLVHQKLSTNSDGTWINFKEYTETLIEQLLRSYKGNKANEINIHRTIENIFLNIDIAVPLGLILNELITNALKYGLSNNKPKLMIALQQSDVLKLTVKDNGIGIDPEFVKKNSLGLKLIHTLVKQLNGTTEVSFKNGTETIIIVPKSV